MIVFVSSFASFDRFLSIAHSQTFPPRLWSQLQTKVLTIAETKAKPPRMRRPARPGEADIAADIASPPGAHRPVIGDRTGCLASPPGAHRLLCFASRPSALASRPRAHRLRCFASRPSAPACVTAMQTEIKSRQRTQLPRAEQVTISKVREQATLLACTSTWVVTQTLILWPQTFATMDPPSFS